MFSPANLRTAPKVVDRPAETTTSTAGVTSDLVLVHKVFRREFQMLPVLLSQVAAGDVGRATMIAAHCRELCTALRHHHAAERELLWPRLGNRSTIDTAVMQRLRDGHRADAALVVELDGLLPLWEQAADTDLRAVLVDIFTELAVAVAAHLGVTEEFVLPGVEAHFGTAEWLTLGLRAASWIPLHRMAWLLGAMLEDATPTERKNLLAKVPGPARLLYRMVGQEQYDKEMRVIRSQPATG